MDSTILKIIAGLFVLVALIAIFKKVALDWFLKSRQMALDDELPAVDDLTDFRRMREEGQIDEEEYKRLKKVMNVRGMSPSGTKDQEYE